MSYQDEKWQEMVGGHQKTLYGDDGAGGVVGRQARIEGCLGKFMTRKWFIGATASAVSFVIILLITLFSTASSKTHEIDKKAQENAIKVQRIEETLKKLETRFEQYHRDIDKKLDTNKREIIEQIKLFIKTQDRGECGDVY